MAASSEGDDAGVLKSKKRIGARLLQGGSSRGLGVSSHSAKQDPRLEAQDAIDKSKKWVAVAKSAVVSAVAPSPSENTGIGKQNKPSGKRAKMGRGVHTCRKDPPCGVSAGRLHSANLLTGPDKLSL